jgi:hypothetical protein
MKTIIIQIIIPLLVLSSGALAQKPQYIITSPSVKEYTKIDNPEDMLRESKEQDKYRLENREKEIKK